MPAQKRSTKEPLLNTVARTLGHAAGTLTNVAQNLTENLVTLPKTMSTTVRRVASSTAAPGRPKKKARRARSTNRVKGATRTAKKRPAKKRSVQSRRGNTSNRKKT